MTCTVVSTGPESPHACSKPPTGSYPLGTIIQCDNCGRRYVLVDKLWSGRVWHKVKTPLWIAGKPPVRRK